MGRLLDEDMVINALQTTKFRNDLFVDRGYARAISIIKELPTIQQEKAQLSKESTTSDLISRQAAIDALDFEIVHMTAYCDGKNEGNPLAQYNKGLEDGKKAIEALPSAQPERKKGRWLPDNNSMYEMRIICSECKESEVVPTIGFTKYKPIWGFCPNCGAKMRGEQHETD